MRVALLGMAVILSGCATGNPGISLAGVERAASTPVGEAVVVTAFVKTMGHSLLLFDTRKDRDGMNAGKCLNATSDERLARMIARRSTDRVTLKLENLGREYWDVISQVEGQQLTAIRGRKAQLWCADRNIFWVLAIEG